MRKPKKKRCAWSKCPFDNGWFTPIRYTTEKTHPNYLCQQGYLQEYNSEKAVKKRFKELKKEVRKNKKTVYQYLQDEVNTIARIIDQGVECHSCDKKGNSYVMHGGHVVSRGSNQTLRYNLLVIWAQCSQCNTHKHGNERAFVLKLEKIYGKELVDEINGLAAQYPSIHLNKVEAKEKLSLARKIVYELKKRGPMIYPPKMRVEMRKEINKTLGIYHEEVKSVA